MRPQTNNDGANLSRPIVRLQRQFSADSDSMASIPGWEVTCLQVTPGKLAGQSVDLHLPSVQLLFEEYRNATTYHAGSNPAATVSFGIALGMNGAGRLNGQRWNDGLCAFDAHCGLDSIVPPTQLISVVVDRDLVNRYVQSTEHLDLDRWLSGGPAIVSSSGLARRLAEQLQWVLHWSEGASSEAPAVGLRMRESVMELLAPHIADKLVAPAARPRQAPYVDVVRKARLYLVERQDSPPEIGALCAALGVSRRWLQLSFNEVLQTNPIVYLRTLRLGGARRMLSSGEPGMQVKDAVEAFGFWHLSRFSHDYRALFGELPSQTLRRAAARA